MLAVVAFHSPTWVARDTKSLSEKLFRYHMSESTRIDLVDRFHNDAALSWRTADTNMVRRYMRQSFDTWQLNSFLHFVPTEYSDLANLTIRMEEPNELVSDSMLAEAIRSTGQIVISRDACWYSDRTFCLSVSKHKLLVEATLLTTWLLSCAAVLYMVFTTPSSIVEGVARILVWSVFLSQPLLFFTAVWPCQNCYDFEIVLVHEIGHILGLLHPDANVSGVPFRCGCGDSATTNCERKDPDAMMNSIFKHRKDSCLTKDDADAVRTIHGGECASPVLCFETEDNSGYVRIAVALVYSIVVSWLVVLCRLLASKIINRYRSRFRSLVV